MRIGFISTRINGSDGVSLEIQKWAAILKQLGHELYYCAGELNSSLEGSLIPRMHFQHPDIKSLQPEIFGVERGGKKVSERITQLKDELYRELKTFLQKYYIELIIVENAFSIPMNVPLALALADLIEDRRLPAIAHHHDFIWERERFAHSWMQSELEKVFPPVAENIKHVVINSLAREELKRRKGIKAEIIPNIFDFTNFNYGLDADNSNFRQALGIDKQDWVVLQPTRIIPRKGIEHAIDLVAQMREDTYRSRLLKRDVKLVLSHPSGDEGDQYFARMKEQAHACSVPLVYAASKVAIGGRSSGKKGKIQLWDAYLNSDFVTYPSLIEGFGNAFLEAVFFRLPLLIRRYDVFVSDIEPLGFDLIKFDQEITSETVRQVIEVITDPVRRRRMVEWNFNLAKTHYSYQVFTPKFSRIIESSLH